MSRYHVVIMGREAPELLTREGYASKGEARRAWATAARGAVLLENGVAIDEKTGTTKTTAAALRRFAAKLKLDVDEPVIDEELEEAAPPPLPARASKVRAGHCPSCDAVLPDHLSTCPTLPAAMPAKGFEFDTGNTVTLPADALRPVTGDKIERGTMVSASMCSKCSKHPVSGITRRTHPGTELWCAHCRRLDSAARNGNRVGGGRKTERPAPRVTPSHAVRGAASVMAVREIIESATGRAIDLVVKSTGVALRDDYGNKIASGTDVATLAREALAWVTPVLDSRKEALDSLEAQIATQRRRVAEAESIRARLAAMGGA